MLFVPLAALGVLAVVEGHVLPGAAAAVGFGLFGGLTLLNARTGRRGVHRARVRVSDGRTALEFPAHRTGTVLTLAMTVVLVAAPLLGAAHLAVKAGRGSTGAGAGAVALVLVTLAILGVLSRLPGGHRGWPSVRLSREGVEVTGVFKGSFLPWDQSPQPVAWMNGVLRLIPASTLHELASSGPARRKDSWTARPGWIGPTAIDADLGVVAAAVLFYELHPERRVELESQAAVERVRGGDLPLPWEP